MYYVNWKVNVTQLTYIFLSKIVQLNSKITHIWTFVYVIFLLLNFIQEFQVHSV
jgi:hypothetical protein